MSQSDSEKKNDGEASVVIQGASVHEDELEEFKVGSGMKRRSWPLP